MRNADQLLPDHAAILATLQRSVVTDVPHPGTVVRVTGPAGPGPSGTLIAPVSGRPCVWFRVVEWRHPVWSSLVAGHVPTPAIAPILASDMGIGAPGATSRESPVPFAVGPVLVDPERADIDAGPPSADTTEGQFRASEYVLRREWLIAPGAPVFAVGAVAPDQPVTLRATPADCVAVSARGEQYLVERARSSLAVLASRGSGRGLVVGLVAAVVVLLAVLAVVLVVAR